MRRGWRGSRIDWPMQVLRLEERVGCDVAFHSKAGREMQRRIAKQSPYCVPNREMWRFTFPQELQGIMGSVVGFWLFRERRKGFADSNLSQGTPRGHRVALVDWEVDRGATRT